MSVLLFAFLAIMFVVGLATPWLIAWTIAGMLPSWLAEPLANLGLRVAFATPGAKILNYNKMGLYDIESVDREDNDIANLERRWSGLAGSAFTICWDCTKDAFGNLSRDIDVEKMYDRDDAELSDTRATTEIERGGFETFVDTSRSAKTADIHVLAGEYLSRFKGIGGARETQDAESAAMYDYAGDTSAESPKVRLAGAVIFALMGFIPAWIIFF